MKTFNINEMKNGWFIGNFEPSIHKTKQFEIAHHFHPKNECIEPHFHKQAWELNYVVDGYLSLMINKETYWFSTGDFFMFEQNEYGKLHFFKNTNIMVIKVPSIPGDKFIVENNE